MEKCKEIVDPFSSPSGAFYFSIKYGTQGKFAEIVFVPFRGFLFFYEKKMTKFNLLKVFVPFRGFLFFYACCSLGEEKKGRVFSSPSGAFYFSIEIAEDRFFNESFSSPSGAFYFSMPAIETVKNIADGSFRPLPGLFIFLLALHTLTGRM